MRVCVCVLCIFIMYKYTQINKYKLGMFSLIVNQPIIILTV